MQLPPCPPPPACLPLLPQPLLLAPQSCSVACLLTCLPAARRDRPDCELVEGGSRGQDAHYHLLGKLVHCNVRLQGDSMQRLVHYADNAMRAWAARTGRFEVLDGISKAAAEGTEGAAGLEPAAKAEAVTQPAAVHAAAATQR